MASLAPRLPRAVMSLADLETSQLQRLIVNAAAIKRQSNSGREALNNRSHVSHNFLKHKSIALLFNKRSTRTRIAAEVAINRLGGHAMFLSDSDIQLGVNESLKDTALVLSQLTSGIFARVGDHSEIEELAANSTIPVINALSSLWHPTQVLADLLTIYDLAPWLKKKSNLAPEQLIKLGDNDVPPLTISYVGDSTNVLHDMMVAYPRLGHKLRVATPDKYKAPSVIWDRVREVDCESGIHWTSDPQEAVHGADFVVTDTWISMGQEAEKAERLQAFKGYQVTENLCKAGGANPDWQFLHCLPRKPDEVDDEVFYGPRSRVFHEAGNRLPTIQALFQLMYKPSNISLTPKKAFKYRTATNSSKPAAS